MEGLYENIGGKLKGLAVVTFVLQTLAAIIYAIVLISDELVGLGLLVLLLGPFAALISSWFTYGIGELIESNCETRDATLEILRNQEKKNDAKKPDAVVVTKPNEGVRVARAVASGKWQCACGRVNEAYSSSCVCGMTKHDAAKKIAEEKE